MRKWSRLKGSGLLVEAVLAVILVAGPAAAQDRYDVGRFGAVGDGETVCTKAIQSAIDACAAAGGGTVHFPAGTYLTGTIYLKSHVRLEVEAGATLLGSTDIEDYPVNICSYPSRSDRYTVRALIWGEGLEHIGLSGHGVIDGQGPAFKDNRAAPEEGAKISAPLVDSGRYPLNEVFVNRPFLIRLVSCRHITVENLHLRRSAMWMQHYLDCDFLTIRGLNVFNHGCRNNDMLDIDCCRNVVVSDCVGDTDDDGLTIKSTGDRPTEFVTITNCILRSRCNALKAGTESSGGFRDIAISNCVIQKSTEPEGLNGRAEGLAGIALEIVDGGSLERVSISNIVIQGTTAPIFMRLGDRARPGMPSRPKPRVGTFRNVSLSQVTATGAGAMGCAIAGLPGHPIENINLSDIRIEFVGGGAAEHSLAGVPEPANGYPECTMFGTLPAYGFFCRNVDGLRMRDVEVSCAEADARPALACDAVRRLRLDGFRGETGAEAPAQVVLRNVQEAFITGSVADAAPFLKLEGESAGIVVMGNDLSFSAAPFYAEPPSDAATMVEVNNRLPAAE